MIWTFLLQDARSIEAYQTGKFTYNIYHTEYGYNFTIVDQIYTKVAYEDIQRNNQDKVVNISDVPNIEYSIDTYNDPDGNFTVIRQTIKNTATTKRRLDLCTAIKFKNYYPEDQDMSAQPINNFGAYIYTPAVEFTWVYENHPNVTNKNEYSIGNGDNPKFFTNRNSEINPDGEDLKWLATSWTNNWLEPGKSSTFSFLIYYDEYNPPILKLQSELIGDEYDTEETIPIKGSFSSYVVDEPISARYEVYDPSSDNVILTDTLGSTRVTEDTTTVQFDQNIKVSQKGNFKLRVVTRNERTESELVWEKSVLIYGPNDKPKIIPLPLDYQYYIPKSDVNLAAYIYSKDTSVTEITTEVYFNNQKVLSQKFGNSHNDSRTLSFKIPEGTAPGDYKIKIVATGGVLPAEKSFDIVVKDNSVLSIDLEGNFNLTFNKDDVVNFTAVVVDPDTNFDSKFTISLYYNKHQKTSISRSNSDGIIRVPMTVSIPSDEKETSAHISVKVKGTNEESETGVTLKIQQSEDKAKATAASVQRKQQKQKKVLIIVLAVMAVVTVCVAVLVIILWLRK
ncbi:hypothetical protein TVAGG3_0583720 [Trichomonas vaginalis G3]|nr:hypothetical protein TVAGG3_0583720 [Trichomonas vaginalis G3]KAI5522751.1 hypothetical protein TVAGG3_0583720 [Trichomonas vaginalis G3]